MKKAIFTVLFSMGLLLNLAFECCPDNSHWNLDSFDIHVYNYRNGQRATASSQIVSDTLALQLYLKAHFMADVMPSNPLISTCQATSCDPYGGEKGMKDEIAQVVISGNTYTNGQLSSQSLNAMALLDGFPVSLWLARKTYNELFVKNLYTDMCLLNILLTQPPTDKPIHDISITFIMKSGAIVQAITPKIIWDKNATVAIHNEIEGN